MPKAEPLRVAVLGAGPVGVEAALYAKACGLTVAVYERGQVGEHLRGSIHIQHAVLRVGRSAGGKKSEPEGTRPFRLLVRDAAGHERIDTADAVLDCTGTFAIPNWLGDGNIPAVGEAAARPHLA